VARDGPVRVGPLTARGLLRLHYCLASRSARQPECTLAVSQVHRRAVWGPSPNQIESAWQQWPGRRDRPVPVAGAAVRPCAPGGLLARRGGPRATTPTPAEAVERATADVVSNLRVLLTVQRVFGAPLDGRLTRGALGDGRPGPGPWGRHRAGREAATRGRLWVRCGGSACRRRDALEPPPVPVDATSVLPPRTVPVDAATSSPAPGPGWMRPSQLTGVDRERLTTQESPAGRGGAAEVGDDHAPTPSLRSRGATARAGRQGLAAPWPGVPAL
jgi:hypothetical protein